MTTGVENGVMESLMEERGQPTEAGKRRKGPDLASSGGHGPAAPWFWISGLRNCERIQFCYFKPPSLGSCVTQPRGNSRQVSSEHFQRAVRQYLENVRTFPQHA